jgi:thioredoxin 1
MQKTGIIITTIIAFLVVGGLIVALSVYKKSAVRPETTSLMSFTDDNFQENVVEASKSRPILVDFYADWCFPCRMLDPILEEVAKDLSGRAVVGKLDTDKNLMARRFGISKIPALFIIRDGEIKDSFFGVVSKETIIKALKDYGG